MIKKFFKICAVVSTILFMGISGAYATDKIDVLRYAGDENAPVVLHEFSSMTCPACQAYHATAVQKLKSEYIDTGKVRLIMHQFPLDNIATVIAMLGLSLPEENYFGFIEYAFQNQQKVRQNPLETLESWAKLSGLNLDEVTNNQDLLHAITRQKNADQKQYNVQGTPTLWINDIKFQYNPRNPEALFKVIDKQVAKNSK